MSIGTGSRSSALLDLLETEIVPLFYQRGPDNMPQRLDARSCGRR